jgi:hypothetical protein
MTTTTPESRGRIAWVAYCRKLARFEVGEGGTDADFIRASQARPMFDDLPEPVRQAWIAAAQTIWDLATTGKAVIQ